MSEKNNQPSTNQQESKANANGVKGGIGICAPKYKQSADNTQNSEDKTSHISSQERKEREDFTEMFNSEFSSILHVFDTGELSSKKPKKSKKSKDEEKKQHLTTEQLACFFTEKQKEMLSNFMETKQIPERLFNGDEIGETNAQQRLLMAAHILAVGKYNPGGFEQKVHARMCYHWVRIVHHYAGATTASSNKDAMGSFDHTNNVILGKGYTKGVYDESSRRVSVDYLPIPAGTSHAKRKSKGKKVHRNISFPISRFDELKPGDWLYYYNANGSKAGSHSVIFSHWIDEEIKSQNSSPLYRTAKVFSQGLLKNGGKEHTVRLGEDFDQGQKIYPITNITRVNEDTTPAQTVDDIVSQKLGIERVVMKSNSSFLDRVCRRYGLPRDKESMEAYVFEIEEELRKRNKILINEISKLNENHRNLLIEANETSELHQLVRLYQRLEGIDRNQNILESNHEKGYAKKNEKHEKQKAIADDKMQKIEEKISQEHMDLIPLEAKEEELEMELLELLPDISTLRKELTELGRKRKKLKPRSEERRAVQEQILKKMEERKILLNIRNSNANKSRLVKRQLNKQRVDVNRRKRRIKSLEKKLAKIETGLPYGLVHMGSLRNTYRGRSKGRLIDVFRYKELKEIIQRAPVEKC